MNARFLTPLRMETIGDQQWLLIDDLVFYSSLYSGRVIATHGLQTNLASIPRIAWTIFPKVGKHDKASVIHDAGYSHSLVTEHGDRIYTVKAVADNLFYEGMKAEGVNSLQAWIMYRAVKGFGEPNAHPLADNRLAVSG
jgi:hypothetical protein